MSTNTPDLMQEAKRVVVTQVVVPAVKAAFDKDVSELTESLVSRLEKPKHDRGEISLPCFHLLKAVGERNPMQLATKLVAAIKTVLEESGAVRETVQDAQSQGPYINFWLTSKFLARIIDAVLDKGFLERRSTENMDRVMVEYSQPNTHKAFHVGHMRNVALGDCLIRIYEKLGHPVVPVNYFGDEGAHVAKCMWLLEKRLAAGFDLTSVDSDDRGEFLGEMYSKAVQMLSLDTYTKYANPGVYSAQIVSVADHPAEDAPANWHVLTVQTKDGPRTVVCGGTGYKEGDIVAHLPVGGTLKGKAVVPKDMKGVESHGVVLAYDELGMPIPASDAPAAKGKKGKKGKKSKAPVTKKIFVFPANEDGTPVAVAVELPELGRYEKPDSVCDVEPIPADKSLSEVISTWKKESADVLHRMEEEHVETCQLWEKTKQWSLAEFKKIYNWLGARFDHDFFESECSSSSKELVYEFLEKGVFQRSEGAVGCDLTKWKLGFGLLLKSNGAGLYATKDLALARIKFDKFNVDKSVYVVDAAQTLHFQQVFKCLELMGYEQAKKCVHLPYGLVTLPDGKMSSRNGTVILFSLLKNLLSAQIDTNFLKQYEGQWPEEEINKARRAIAVGTIRYGMLSHDASKDIVFNLEEWTAPTGDTGPYIMYSYTRIAGIEREIPEVPKEAVVDFSLLQHKTERYILTQIAEFWSVVQRTASKTNPNLLCAYLFDLAKNFSSWYTVKEHNIKKSAPDLMVTRLAFVRALAKVFEAGLHLLGMEVLERM